MMPPVEAVFRKAMVCAVLAGCSGGAGSGGLDGGHGTGPIAVDDYADAVIAAVCERAVDCSLYPDFATCVAARKDVSANLVNVADFVRTGVTQYDPVAAAACLDALPRNCWRQYDWFLVQKQFLETAICRKVFKGTLPGSAPCCSGIECVSELCGGRCQPEPLVQVGGHCDGNTLLFCEYGLLCSPEGICEAPLPIGANCADQPNRQCEPPSYCSSAAMGSSMPGICTVDPDEGEPCDWNLSNCLRLDDYCDSETGVCTRRLPPGAPCTVLSSPCVPYGGCNNDVCDSRAGLGEACIIATGCIDVLPCVNNVCSPSPAPVPICQP